MGSAAPAVEELSPALDPQPVAREARVEANAESLRDAVLNALGNQPMLVSLLENAEWRLEGNALTAKVAASSTMIEMSFTADARRVASAAASGLAGRPIKMLVEPDGAPQAAPAPRRSSSKGSASNGSARSRRTGPDRATHAGKIRSRNPHRDRLSGERMKSFCNLVICNFVI
jgi:hypothetical protein